jgi:hypothetical protein
MFGENLMYKNQLLKVAGAKKPKKEVDKSKIAQSVIHWGFTDRCMSWILARQEELHTLCLYAKLNTSNP